MNVKKVRITEELTWSSLKDRFVIGNFTHEGVSLAINQLKDAIDNGTLLAMVVNCADKMHDGNVTEVVEAIKRNLSSNATNFKKKEYNPTADQDNLRLSLLWNFFDGLSIKEKKVTEGLPETLKEKALWALTTEEIEGLDKSNYKILDSVYQNMQSHKSKTGKEVVLAADPQYLDRLALISKYRSECRAAAKKAESEVVIPTELLTKAAAGKLTKADQAELSEFLMRLRK